MAIKDDDPGEAGQARSESDDTPRLISTIYVTTLDDTIEMLRAADTLGLGVRVHNRWILEESDPDGSEPRSGEWVVELRDEAPDVSPDDD